MISGLPHRQLRVDSLVMSIWKTVTAAFHISAAKPAMSGRCLRHLFVGCTYGSRKCRFFHSDTVLTDDEKADVANEAARQWAAANFDYGDGGGL